MYKTELRLTHMYISTNKYKLSNIMATTCTHMRHIISIEIHKRDISILIFVRAFTLLITMFRDRQKGVAIC